MSSNATRPMPSCRRWPRPWGRRAADAPRSARGNGPARGDWAEARCVVASIGEATRRMQAMLDALLDVPRLDGGVMEPYPEWFCVEAMLARLKTEYGTAARAQALRLDMGGRAP